MPAFQPTFARYQAYRRAFAVSRESALAALAWAEPLARQALGIHARRDMMGLGEALPLIPHMTSAATNGGWGLLMPVWFKPYERPVPLYVLDNWAMPALAWHAWLGEGASAFTVETLLQVLLGGDILIPFLPQVQGGGHFLRQGAFAILLGLLWLEPAARGAALAAIDRAATRFAAEFRLAEQEDLAAALGQLEFEALFLAESLGITGDEAARAFLADQGQFRLYSALYGALSFSLAALYDWLGPDWEAWVFQKVNLDYRLARFGLEAWARRLGLLYEEPPPDESISRLFRGE